MPIQQTIHAIATGPQSQPYSGESVNAAGRITTMDARKQANFCLLFFSVESICISWLLFFLNNKICL